MYKVKIGKIVQISGPVIDVDVRGRTPAENQRSALGHPSTEKSVLWRSRSTSATDTVRCIMLYGSEGLYRGMDVKAPGKTIEVPVGQITLGRMFNVLGNPIDGGEAIPQDAPRKSIYRKPPSFETRARLSIFLRPASRSSTCWNPTPRAARSVCSAAQVLAKRF